MDATDAPSTIDELTQPFAVAKQYPITGGELTALLRTAFHLGKIEGRAEELQRLPRRIDALFAGTEMPATA